MKIGIIACRGNTVTRDDVGSYYIVTIEQVICLSCDTVSVISWVIVAFVDSIMFMLYVVVLVMAGWAGTLGETIR